MVKNYTFFSFVGTQCYGTLHPLVTCLQNYNKLKIDKVILIASGKSKKYAQKIDEFCKSIKDKKLKDFPSENLPSVEIIDDWKPGETSSKDIVSLVENEGNILFNATGGMSFSCAEFIIDMYENSPSLLVCLQNKAFFLDYPYQVSTPLTLKSPLPPQVVLDAQHVSWSQNQGQSQLALDFQEQTQKGNYYTDIKFPTKRLENIQISGFDFSIVWNDENNILNFLYYIPWEQSNSQNQDDKRLELARKLSHWAGNRDDNQLFDREFNVICPTSSIAEHLLEESRGKIATFVKKGNDIKSTLSEIFAQKNTEEPNCKGIRYVPSDSLVVVLGDDETPTLITINSHKQPNLLLCCTQDSAMKSKAESLKTLIEQQKIFPHIKNVTIVPTDISGSVLLHNLRLENDATNIHVNITPGTKSQSAFLTVWAQQNNCSVWSLVTRDQCMKRLDCPSGHIKAVGIDPLFPLLVRYPGKVQYEALASEDDRKVCEYLLEHMKGCLAANGSWALAVQNEWGIKKSQQYNGFNLCRLSKIKWQISSPYGPCKKFSTIGGRWFEQLVAYALEKAGVRHTHFRVRLPWSEELRKYLEYKHQQKTHRIDMDVLGTWGTAMILVSCKTGNTRGTAKAAEEAKSMATSICRFAVPLLCSLKIEQAKDYADVKDAKCFGWKELCDEKMLASLLNGACWSRGQSNASSQNTHKK